MYVCVRAYVRRGGRSGRGMRTCAIVGGVVVEEVGCVCVCKCTCMCVCVVFRER